MFPLKTNMVIFVEGDEGKPNQKPEGGDEPPGRARWEVAGAEYDQDEDENDVDDGDDDKVLCGDDDFDDGDEEMNHQDELVKKLQV